MSIFPENNNSTNQTLTAVVQPINEKLEELVDHTSGKVNIQSYDNLIISNDWTAAITKAIADCPNGGTIFFPEGEYMHKGFTVPAKYLNFEGCGRFGTFLINTEVGKNAITIADNAERGSFKNMAILGNGEQIYGTDATSGHGIVFSNDSVSWNFENITVRGHGGNGFHGGHTGNVNNINIQNSEIEFNKGCGIHFMPVAGLSQINAINISCCNISNNGGSGLELWGNNINISNNTVQANRKYGYDINSDLIQGTGSISCNSIMIENNYSEGHILGLLHVKVDKINSPLTYKYVNNLIFSKNFGSENVSNIKAIIKLEKGKGLNESDRALASFRYSDNSLFTDSAKLIDGNNLLFGDSLIQTNMYESTENYTNLGQPRFEPYGKTITFNNFISSKSTLSFDLMTGKSSNITVTTSSYYTFNPGNFTGIDLVGVPIETNKTDFKIDFIIYGRPLGSKISYNVLQTISLTSANLSNGVLSQKVNKTANLSKNPDLFLEVKVSPGKTGSNLYFYNPVIILG